MRPTRTYVILRLKKAWPWSVVLGVFLFSYFLYLRYLSSLYRIPVYNDMTLIISHATQLAQGQPYADVYRGFGYPLLLGLPLRLRPDVDLFAVAKSINCLSTVVALAFFYLLFAKLANKKVALLSVLLVATTTFFFDLAVVYSVTDMFFMALCAASMYLSLSTSSWPRVLIAGLCAGYAFITRYNGIFLVGGYLAWLGLFLFIRWRTDDKALASPRALLRCNLVPYCLAFSFAACPWLLYNYRLHGDPLYNRNYLNMMHGIYGPAEWIQLWGRGADYFRFTSAAQVVAIRASIRDNPLHFSSAADIILLDPLHFSRTWLRNVATATGKSVEMAFQLRYLRWGVLLGFALFCLHLTQRRSLILLSLCLYQGIVGLALFDFRLYALSVAFYAFFLALLADWIAHRVRIPLRALQVPWVGLLSAGLVLGRAYVALPRAQVVANRNDASLAKAAAYVTANYAEENIAITDPVLSFLAKKPLYSLGYVEDGPSLMEHLTQLQHPVLLYYDAACNLRLGCPFGLGLDSLLDAKNGRDYLKPLLVLNQPKAVLYLASSPQIAAPNDGRVLADIPRQQ